MNQIGKEARDLNASINKAKELSNASQIAVSSNKYQVTADNLKQSISDIDMLKGAPISKAEINVSNQPQNNLKMPETYAKKENTINSTVKIFRADILSSSAKISNDLIMSKFEL